jgi:hypothetical protein
MPKIPIEFGFDNLSPAIIMPGMAKECKLRVAGALAITTAFILLALPACRTPSSRQASAMLRGDFTRVRSIAERKFQVLASPAKPGYGGGVWFTNRMAQVQKEQAGVAQYAVQAVMLEQYGKLAPIESTRVSCGIELREQSPGMVAFTCTGKAWRLHTIWNMYMAEHLWSPQRFLAEVREELPEQPVPWGQPQGGLRIGLCFSQHTNLQSGLPNDPSYPPVLVYL